MIPLRVLIVEDNPDDAEIMILHLVQEGFQLDWERVETEVEFLSGLESSPDLVLSDWRLPHFSGQRALELLLERNLELPFVIVSGSIDEEIAVESLHAGAHDYVLKDRLARLGQAVRGALKEKKLLEERRQANNALQDSEERLRLSTELAHVAVWKYDFLANNMEHSANLDQLYGLEPQKKWDSNTFLNAIHPKDRDYSNQMIQRSAASGGPDDYTFDFRVIYPDQSLHWLTVVGQVVERNERGEGLLARGCLIEITDRKQSQEKVIRQLEELQRWQNIMLDREDRVQELKREVNELCRKVGEGVRYPSQEALQSGSGRDEPEI